MLDANLGTIGIWLAFLACLAGIVVSIVGLVSHRRFAGTGTGDRRADPAQSSPRRIGPQPTVDCSHR